MIEKIKVFVVKRFDLIFMGMLFLSLLVKHWLSLAYLFSSTGYFFDFTGYFRNFKIIYLFSPLAVIVLLLSFSLFFSGWRRYICGLVSNVFFTACIITDFVYARAFYSLPSFIWVILFANSKSEVRGSITSLLWWTDLLFLVDFIILIPLCLVMIRKYKKNPPEHRSRKKRLISFLIAFLSSVLVLSVLFGHDFLANDEEDYVPENDLTGQAVALTSAGFHIKDALKVIFYPDEISGLTEEQQQEIEEFYTWKNADGGAPSAPFGQTKGQNIIFLQVESLENFTIGNEINGQEITPNINKMLDHSYRFNRVYEQVKGGNSSDCDLMLMTSMLPIENGPAFILYEQSSFHSLPSILREEGNYYTAYFNGEKNSMWNYEMVMESAIQFDTYSMDYSQDVIYNQYLSDESMLNQTLPKVVQVVQDAGENPFYAHIVLCSSHMPFQLPQEEWLLDLPSDLKGTYMGNYLECVAYVDHAIGEFLDGLEQAGLMKNTMVIITGDHGGVHKYYPQRVDKFSREYPWMGTSETYTVPLIFCSPELEGREYDLYSGHVDVMPSLLHLLGISPEVYQNTAMGRNLFCTSRNFVIQPNGTIRGDYSDEEVKYIKKMYTYADLLIRGYYGVRSN
jgi:uncharacterized sulfatase